MAIKRVRKNRYQETVELNITAFLNLMVILIPFLLITAVFSRMTVLELNLPALNAAQKENPDEKINLQLQLLIRPSALELRDNNLGVLKKTDIKQDGTHWPILRKVLIEIKTRFPEEQAISLLMDKSVDYKMMIEAMDQVRSANVVNITEVENIELFPNISIGDLAADIIVEAEVSNDE